MMVLTWHARYEPERTEDPERPERLHVETLDLQGAQDYAHDADHHNGEVEQIPRAPQIGRGMLPEAVRDDLHDALAREDHQEDVLDFLLQEQRRERQLNERQLLSQLRVSS